MNRTAVGWRGGVLVGAALTLTGCATEKGLARRVERAHEMDRWTAREVAATDLRVDFGGQTILEGRMWVEINGDRSRLELSDGATLVFDGDDAWVAPPHAPAPQARFHLRTWPYFLEAPYKLRDPGTILEDRERRMLDGAEHHSMRLSFEPGVGDTPDDWYLLYVDPATHLLEAMAYIVTYGTPLDEAESDPHAIEYDEFTPIEGVPVPMRWTFRSWNEERGVFGDPLGGVHLSEFEFVPASQVDFNRPANSRRDKLPGE
ncbi:MAG: hypothetical protein ACF8PN_07170 [Phycisphaerales bacterium]